MTRATMAVAAACGLAVSTSAFQSPGAETISKDRLRGHLKTLASDDYEGRAPGTRGERLTVDYLTRQFKSYGLRGANPDGSFEQPVPLVSWAIRGSATLITSARTRNLEWARDFFVLQASPPPVGETDIPRAPLVFAGDGIVAPASGRNDYAGFDARGKFVVVRSAGARNAKISAAKEHGALGVLIAFEPTPAAATLNQSIGHGAREIGVSPPPAGLPAGDRFVAALIAPEVFAELEAGSTRGAELSIHLTRTDRAFTSPNVVAVLPGSDPARRDEVIVYTGHWDHLGRDERRSGDQIYNGAVDNAGGIAQLLEIARALGRRSPKRTVVFMATTAEEEGLVGAKHYIAHPLFPLNKTVADINLDGFWPLGPLPDLVEFGAGNTTFDEIVQATAAALHRRVIPDPMPNEHFYQRSDQWPFALAGIPAIFPSGWPAPHPENPSGRDLIQDYLANDYHKVSDEYHADWDLVGAVNDAEWMLEFGWRLAQSSAWAKWKPDAPCQPCKPKGG